LKNLDKVDLLGVIVIKNIQKHIANKDQAFITYLEGIKLISLILNIFYLESNKKREKVDENCTRNIVNQIFRND
jgi:hypothetical protein